MTIFVVVVDLNEKRINCNKAILFLNWLNNCDKYAEFQPGVQELITFCNVVVILRPLANSIKHRWRVLWNYTTSKPIKRNLDEQQTADVCLQPLGW